MQVIISTLIVAACAGYAVRALLPAAWRQRERGTGKQAACGGCSGCADRAAPVKATQPQVLHWLPRKPGRRGKGG